ncbi:hypothetical protein SAMN05444147_102247 [Pectobacterium carotovorum]|nr:hypothetical protein PEC301889_26150 [Pectobacterium carotovorum subsp. carotovorum]SHG35996.1 hypothetical protein SAMN05444147_102247 [Pectobacterium carotovorum]
MATQLQISVKCQKPMLMAFSVSLSFLYLSLFLFLKEAYPESLLILSSSGIIHTVFIRE